MSYQPERYRGAAGGVVVELADQEQAKKLLASWRCVCVRACGCFPLQKMVERAAQGKVLFHDQLLVLHQLLKREGQ